MRCSVVSVFGVVEVVIHWVTLECFGLGLIRTFNKAFADHSVVRGPQLNHHCQVLPCGAASAVFDFHSTVIAVREVTQRHNAFALQLRWRRAYAQRNGSALLNGVYCVCASENAAMVEAVFSKVK